MTDTSESASPRRGRGRPPGVTAALRAVRAHPFASAIDREAARRLLSTNATEARTQARSTDDARSAVARAVRAMRRLGIPVPARAAWRVLAARMVLFLDDADPGPVLDAVDDPPPDDDLDARVAAELARRPASFPFDLLLDAVGVARGRRRRDPYPRHRVHAACAACGRARAYVQGVLTVFSPGVASAHVSRAAFERVVAGREWVAAADVWSAFGHGTMPPGSRFMARLEGAVRAARWMSSRGRDAPGETPGRAGYRRRAPGAPRATVAQRPGPAGTGRTDPE